MDADQDSGRRFVPPTFARIPGYGPMRWQFISVGRPASRIKVLSTQLFEKDGKDHYDAFRILKVEPICGA